MTTKTEASHTPGPWDIMETGEGRTWYVHRDKIKICQHIPIKDKANARLIAAAPELLEALYKAIYILKEIYGPIGETQRYTIAELEAAIAKAEGGK